ncbi:hypothetical protein HK105_207783 [Polyrhizophydium stewartii]|uniref:Inner centromere protein ARK-binding domain-containing protein n=1 Tax=Polyrhizophydium stewartii TaxID=2732419 RepID=A0ABR4MZR4_9FUNG
MATAAARGRGQRAPARARATVQAADTQHADAAALPSGLEAFAAVQLGDVQRLMSESDKALCAALDEHLSFLASLAQQLQQTQAEIQASREPGAAAAAASSAPSSTQEQPSAGSEPKGADVDEDNDDDDFVETKPVRGKGRSKTARAAASKAGAKATKAAGKVTKAAAKATGRRGAEAAASDAADQDVDQQVEAAPVPPAAEDAAPKPASPAPARAGTKRTVEESAESADAAGDVGDGGSAVSDDPLLQHQDPAAGVDASGQGDEAEAAGLQAPAETQRKSKRTKKTPTLRVPKLRTKRGKAAPAAAAESDEEADPGGAATKPEPQADSVEAQAESVELPRTPSTSALAAALAADEMDAEPAASGDTESAQPQPPEPQHPVLDKDENHAAAHSAARPGVTAMDMDAAEHDVLLGSERASDASNPGSTRQDDTHMPGAMPDSEATAAPSAPATASIAPAAKPPMTQARSRLYNVPKISELGPVDTSIGASTIAIPKLPKLSRERAHKDSDAHSTSSKESASGTNTGAAQAKRSLEAVPEDAENTPVAKKVRAASMESQRSSGHAASQLPAAPSGDARPVPAPRAAPEGTTADKAAPIASVMGATRYHSALGVTAALATSSILSQISMQADVNREMSDLRLKTSVAEPLDMMRKLLGSDPSSSAMPPSLSSSSSSLSSAVPPLSRGTSAAASAPSTRSASTEQPPLKPAAAALMPERSMRALNSADASGSGSGLSKSQTKVEERAASSAATATGSGTGAAALSSLAAAATAPAPMAPPFRGLADAPSGIPRTPLKAGIQRSNSRPEGAAATETPGKSHIPVIAPKTTAAAAAVNASALPVAAHSSQASVVTAQEAAGAPEPARPVAASAKPPAATTSAPKSSTDPIASATSNASASSSVATAATTASSAATGAPRAKPEIKSLQAAAAAAKKEQAEKERRAKLREAKDLAREQTAAATAAAAAATAASKAAAAAAAAAQKDMRSVQPPVPAVAPVQFGQHPQPAQGAAKPLLPVKVGAGDAQAGTKPKLPLLQGGPSALAGSVRVATAAPSGLGPSLAGTTSSSSAAAAAAGSTLMGVPKPMGPPKNPILPPGGFGKKPMLAPQAGGGGVARAGGVANAAGGGSSSGSGTDKGKGAQVLTIVGDDGELPEPASEYTDSDESIADETPQAKKIASWARTPFVREALRRQQQQDPDDIFGTVKPIRLDEIFGRGPADAQRLRKRTSSAHWLGTDALTAEEELAYKRRMGYMAGDEDEGDERAAE